MRSDEHTVRPAIAAALSEVYMQKLADPSASFGDLAFMFVSALNRGGHVVVPIGSPAEPHTHQILIPIDTEARTYVAGKIGIGLGIARALGANANDIVLELEEALEICAPKPK